MLAYILAIVVGLGSLAIYIAAFFFPEVHRKSDFLWSGLGLFYALILWTCAGRITGAVLLGQMASVALIGWFGWQTLSLRREVTPAMEQTKIPSKDSTSKSVKFPGVKDRAKPTTTPQTETNETAVAIESNEEQVGAESITQPRETVEEISSEMEVPTSGESETLETFNNLTQPTETDTETEATFEKTEVKPEIKLDKSQTKTQDSSEKKPGGVSAFLKPVNSLVSSIQNVFSNKDKSKTNKSAAGPETKANKVVSVAETETSETMTSLDTEVSGQEEPEFDFTQEQVTVVEKEAIVDVDKTSGEDTPDETVVKVEGEESNEELTSAVKPDEVESQDNPPQVSPEVPSVSKKDSDSEKES